MKQKKLLLSIAVSVLAILIFGASYLSAHCDGLDGPVVRAAQQALATNNVNLVLIWVPEASEPELREVFQHVTAVRQLNPQSRTLADRYFFETLVRLHRAGEGAPYTGLKPAGRDLGPAIPAADRALESGETAALEAMLVKALRKGVEEAFARAQARRTYDANDVRAGREYVKAYVEYVHYVERLHEALANPARGHFAEE